MFEVSFTSEELGQHKGREMASYLVDAAAALAYFVSDPSRRLCRERADEALGHMVSIMRYDAPASELVTIARWALAEARASIERAFDGELAEVVSFDFVREHPTLAAAAGKLLGWVFCEARQAIWRAASEEAPDLAALEAELTTTFNAILKELDAVVGAPNSGMNWGQVLRGGLEH